MLKHKINHNNENGIKTKSDPEGPVSEMVSKRKAEDLPAAVKRYQYLVPGQCPVQLNDIKTKSKSNLS